MKLQAYYDRTHRRIPGSFTQNLDTYDVISSTTSAGAAHDLVMGLGYRLVEDDVVNTPANAFLPPRVGRAWSNAFAQDEITLQKDRLHLTLGTKVEHNNGRGLSSSPARGSPGRPMRNRRFGARFHARSGPRRASIATSTHQPRRRIASRASNNVVSEKLMAYELGYRVQVDPQLALSLATFYNDYEDLRSLEPLDRRGRFRLKPAAGCAASRPERS